MAASTPSMCLRSDSDSVHSHTSAQASSRVGVGIRGRVFWSAPERVWTMEKFVIEGGTPLAGTVVPAGNKNAALPALAACLLTREEVVLRNIPRIADVEAMLEILRLLEVNVEWREENVVSLCAANLDSGVEIPVEKTDKIRASFL